MRVSRLCFLLLLGASFARGEIRIVGSDLLGPTLPATVQAYAGRNELNLTVKLTGSHAGWEELQAGRADLALLSFPPGESLPGSPYHCVPLAYHTAMVLVSAALPLEQISFGQLAGIFGPTGPADFRRWGDLGLTGEWTAHPISPFALKSRVALAPAVFRHEVLADAALRPGVVELDSVDALVRQFTNLEGAIGLAAALPPGSEGVKALPVARDAGVAACAPTPENVHRGDYPLRWPVYLVFRRADVSRLFALLRYLQGDEVAGNLGAAGLMPVPQEVRNGQIFDLEQL